MRRRLIVSVVAIVGMLMHAAMFAHHNGLMARGAEVLDPLLGQIVICHSGAPADQSSDSNPFLPKLPDPQKASCAVCCGTGTFPAVTASTPGETGISVSLLVQYRSVPKQVAVPSHTIGVPPSRGPPLNA
jgi:hypothetical protein